MANRTITEHEIKGEYKFIREITKTYVTVNGVERLFDTHRGNQHTPGVLQDETYHPNAMTSFNDDLSALASHFWTQDVHNDWKEELLKKKEEQDAILNR